MKTMRNLKSSPDHHYCIGETVSLTAGAPTQYMIIPGTALPYAGDLFSTSEDNTIPVPRSGTIVGLSVAAKQDAGTDAWRIRARINGSDVSNGLPYGPGDVATRVSSEELSAGFLAGDYISIAVTKAGNDGNSVTPNVLTIMLSIRWK